MLPLQSSHQVCCLVTCQQQTLQAAACHDRAGQQDSSKAAVMKLLSASLLVSRNWYVSSSPEPQAGCGCGVLAVLQVQEGAELLSERTATEDKKLNKVRPLLPQSVNAVSTSCLRSCSSWPRLEQLRLTTHRICILGSILAHQQA
jgi:hypothetical protein